MSAEDNLSGQFRVMSLSELGRLRSADFPGRTMNQVAKAPQKAHREAGLEDRYSRSDFRRLVSSVRQEGVRDPVTVEDGVFYDGHNRFRAAKRAGQTHIRVQSMSDELDGVAAQYQANRRVP